MIFVGYRDVAQVGVVGLGNLYRAVRESTGGVVAIKEIRDIATGSPMLHRDPVVPIAAGWFRDPSGRHELRWWNGTAWTEHVSIRGSPGIDHHRPDRVSGR